MKKIKLVSLSLLATVLFLVSCGGLTIPIDKNKIVSDVEIQFVSKNVKLKQNDVFNLSELGLVANNSAGTGARVSFLQDVTKTIKAFKKNSFINYDIIIKSPKYSKPYYGKIAFFNISKKNSDKAVARYREISINDDYFTSATRGRTALMYEYTTHLQMGVSELKTPTWVLLMSDEPF